MGFGTPYSEIIILTIKTVTWEPSVIGSLVARKIFSFPVCLSKSGWKREKEPSIHWIGQIRTDYCEPRDLWKSKTRYNFLCSNRSLILNGLHSSIHLRRDRVMRPALGIWLILGCPFWF
jgi:hypothetical protein